MVSLMEDLGIPSHIEETLQQFHYTLLKRYIALVDSPFLLKRLCSTMYREDGYDQIFHEQTLEDILLDLMA